MIVTLFFHSRELTRVSFTGVFDKCPISHQVFLHLIIFCIYIFLKPSIFQITIQIYFYEKLLIFFL